MPMPSERCTYCWYNDIDTKSPLDICGDCYDYLGRAGRRQLLKVRREEGRCKPVHYNN